MIKKYEALAMKKEKIFEIFFFIFLFYFLTWGIDLMLFTYPDEGRNAFATLFMMKSGNYIVPYYNGEIRYDKPPLLYYMAILLYNFFKIFNYENIELCFRMVSVLATFLSGLVVFELSKYFIFEKICRYFAVFLYFSMVNIFIESKAFVPEPLLSLFINFSLLAFFKLYNFKLYNQFDNKTSKIWSFLFWISIGLGVLTKGIVAIIVVFLVITVFLIFEKNLGFIKIIFKDVVYVSIGLLIGFSWFIAVGIETNGEFLYNFFWVHNIGRFTGSSNMHPNPFYFYLPIIILNTLPFIELFILFVVMVFKTYLGKEKKLNFLWLYLGMILVFYSLSTGKVHHYIMPSLVPLSILITYFIEKIREEKVKNIENWIWVSIIIPLLLTLINVPPIFTKLKNGILALFLIFIPIYFLILRYNRKLIFISTFIKVIIFYGLLLYNLPLIFPDQKQLLDKIRNKEPMMLGDISTISFYNLYLNNISKTQDLWYILSEDFNKETLNILEKDIKEKFSEILKSGKEIILFSKPSKAEKIRKLLTNYEIEEEFLTVAQSKLIAIKIKGIKRDKK